MSFKVDVIGKKEVVKALNSSIKATEKTKQDFFDKTTKRIKSLMVSSAPRGKTGNLKQSIDIKSERKNVFYIGPLGGEGSRSSPKPERYSRFVERGNKRHFPNVTDISIRYGVSMREAFAIAKKISKKRGRRYRFVANIMNTVERYVETEARKMGHNIVAIYEK